MVFDEESMLQSRSKGGASDSSVDTQNRGVEFSESPKRHEESEENFSDSDGDE